MDNISESVDVGVASFEVLSVLTEVYKLGVLVGSGYFEGEESEVSNFLSVSSGDVISIVGGILEKAWEEQFAIMAEETYQKRSGEGVSCFRACFTAT